MGHLTDSGVFSQEVALVVRLSLVFFVCEAVALVVGLYIQFTDLV